MLRVAITRALPEAERTADRVRARGAEPVLASLFRIEMRPMRTDLADAQALLFTSANGVRAFASQSTERAIATLTVGDATAHAARAAGFTDVRSADGDVTALAHLAQTQLDPAAGALVHISGAHVAGDLVQALRGAGFQAERRVAYEACALTTAPEAFSQPLDIVLFHSARAAMVFEALGAPGAARLKAACLSPAVAEAARTVPWGDLVVAPALREEALLEAALAARSP